MICNVCGKQFIQKHVNHISCSECAKAIPNLVSMIDMPLMKPTIGAISELIAGADLLRRGYSVFRALSPSSPCDLIAIATDGAVLRIEVRTGTRRAGKLQYPTREFDNGRCDLHAVVTYDGDVTTVTYIPDLP